jgi:hypothetical protein
MPLYFLSVIASHPAAWDGSKHRNKRIAQNNFRGIVKVTFENSQEFRIVELPLFMREFGSLYVLEVCG